MKKIILLLLSTALTLAFLPQEQHEVAVVNIEVPVRAFSGSTFVDRLTIDDFEVYEDGKVQKIAAVYLISKNKVRMEEGEHKFTPDVTRNFVLLFEIQDYMPKIGAAIDYFFNNVIGPGDTLRVITSMNIYNFKDEALRRLPRHEIANQLKWKIRQDAKIGNSEYRNLIKELEESLIGEQFLDEKLQRYSDILRRLENIRSIDEKNLLNFADYLKSLEGQKHVFMFYQKELVPKLSPQELDILMSTNQDRMDIVQTILDLFVFFQRDVSFDLNRVKQAFSDSSVSVHFLFITKPPEERAGMTSMRPSGLQMVEQSEDIFNAFREVALATGGFVESSADASVAFQSAVNASENYYLIYYAPQNYTPDGKFKNIEVKVKNKGYRVLHRAGYIAN